MTGPFPTLPQSPKPWDSQMLNRVQAYHMQKRALPSEGTPVLEPPVWGCWGTQQQRQTPPPPLDQLLHWAPRNLQRSREDLHRSLSGERDLGAEVGGGRGATYPKKNTMLTWLRRGKEWQCLQASKGARCLQPGQGLPPIDLENLCCTRGIGGPRWSQRGLA